MTGDGSVPAPLAAFGANVYSQYGEDGIIAEVLRRMGQQASLDRWCAEVGAWNGVHLSNTARLIREQGYNAVMIEADHARCQTLRENYPEGNVTAICAEVGSEPGSGLNTLFAHTKIPLRFDLLSIDIDGNDYHVWAALTTYRPKVVVIEYNPTIPNELEFVQAANPHVHQGASPRSLVQLGETKGYTLCAATWSNLIFIDAQFAESVLGNDVPTLEDLRDDSLARCFAFVGFDGTILTSRPVILRWHRHTRVPSRALQFLPWPLRKYPGGYSRLDEALLMVVLAYKVPRQVIGVRLRNRRGLHTRWATPTKKWSRRSM